VSGASGPPPDAPRPALPGIALLVDDDALFLRTLQRALQRRGIETRIAGNAAEALAQAADTGAAPAPDLALVDLKLGAESGLALIEPLRRLQPRMRILLLTGYASVATAVEAIKRGADNYLIKPATVEMILRAWRDDPAAPAAPAPLSATMTPLSRLEWEHIQQALTETRGNISAAARLLGMHRRSLQRKLAKRPGPERAPS
jgi:two-component system, response regulator RegA